MERVYLDNNASAKIRPEVIDTIKSFLRDFCGNPSSVHAEGRLAKKYLGEARRQVADLIGADPAEIVFTSGGTESNNLALKGILARHGNPHLITSSVEHPSVLQVGRILEESGVELTVLSVNGKGEMSLEDLRESIRPNTALLSLMWANNETGIIFPISEVTALMKERGIPFHVDAVQIAGKLPIDVKKEGIDLLSLSGHKMGSPSGSGALYVRVGLEIEPLLHGSPQERGRRAGTESLLQFVALGRAAAVAKEELEGGKGAELEKLRDYLETNLLSEIPHIIIHGRGTSKRVPQTSSVTVEGVPGDTLMMVLDLEGFSVSLGPACTSGILEPSHVLLAMGLPRKLASSTIRVSLGWQNTKKDVDRFIEAMARLVKRLRQLKVGEDLELPPFVERDATREEHVCHSKRGAGDPSVSLQDDKIEGSG